MKLHHSRYHHKGTGGPLLCPTRQPLLTPPASRRLGHPDDIAELALFLCAERARHIQGTAIAVDAWTQERVRGFRNHHEIAGHRDGEWAERGEITLEAAAKIIGVCNMTALRMLRRGNIKGRQVCPGAPWVIKTADLTGFTSRKRSDLPLTPNPDQLAFDIQ